MFIHAVMGYMGEVFLQKLVDFHEFPCIPVHTMKTGTKGR